MWTYFLLWFPMLVLAVVNGGAREMLYKASLGELRAHQLSTLTLFILFSIYIWRVTHIWPPESSGQSLLIGLLWLILTLGFEFGSGRAAGHSWRAMLQAYNVRAGRVWVFIPMLAAIGPFLFYQLQK